MICSVPHERQTLSETSTSRAADPRPERTRTLLFDALLELIQEKRWDKIRVQDLLDRTGLGRSTFYAHFDNKFGLLTAAIPSITLPIGTTGEDMPDLQPLFEHVEEMRPVLRPLLSQPLLGEITDVFHRQLAEAWCSHLAARGLEPEAASMTSQFLAGALMAVCRDWLNNDCKRPAHELCKDFTTLVARVTAEPPS